MRIIGEFDAGEIKVTVFKMNERISIKFEKNLLEQTYKFRDGSSINTLQDAQTFCSDKTIDKINHIFNEMVETRGLALTSILQNNDEGFDEII